MKKYYLPKKVTGLPTVPCATSLTLMAVTSYTCNKLIYYLIINLLPPNNLTARNHAQIICFLKKDRIEIGAFVSQLRDYRQTYIRLVQTYPSF